MNSNNSNTNNNNSTTNTSTATMSSNNNPTITLNGSTSTSSTMNSNNISPKSTIPTSTTTNNPNSNTSSTNMNNSNSNSSSSVLGSSSSSLLSNDTSVNDLYKLLPTSKEGKQQLPNSTSTPSSSASSNQSILSMNSPTPTTPTPLSVSSTNPSITIQGSSSNNTNNNTTTNNTTINNNTLKSVSTPTSTLTPSSTTTPTLTVPNTNNNRNSISSTNTPSGTGSGTAALLSSSRRVYPTYADQYQLLEPIGYGLGGPVYEAICLPFSEHVAIKKIDLERLPDNVLSTITKEIHTMVTSFHEHIVNYLTSFINETELYLVMELLEGGSIFDIMRFRFPIGLPNEELISCILYQVLKGLEYFHSNGQIHRDIKASNLLVSSEGVVRIGDFGVSANIIEISGDRKSKRQTFVGSPCWMAPEVMAQFHGYDTKADIWSLGITAIELATGKAPLEGLPPVKVMFITMEHDPPQLQDVDQKKFSKNFKDLVSCCLQKDPNKRPSASQLLKHKFFSKVSGKFEKQKVFIKRALLEGLPPLSKRAQLMLSMKRSSSQTKLTITLTEPENESSLYSNITSTNNNPFTQVDMESNTSYGVDDFRLDDDETGDEEETTVNIPSTNQRKPLSRWNFEDELKEDEESSNGSTSTNTPTTSSSLIVNNTNGSLNQTNNNNTNIINSNNNINTNTPTTMNGSVYTFNNMNNTSNTSSTANSSPPELNTKKIETKGRFIVTDVDEDSIEKLTSETSPIDETSSPQGTTVGKRKPTSQKKKRNFEVKEVDVLPEDVPTISSTTTKKKTEANTVTTPTTVNDPIFNLIQQYKQEPSTVPDIVTRLEIRLKELWEENAKLKKENESLKKDK
ncbi:hypothetical protein ABK040_005260 [Willaertia magna]